MAPQPVLVRTYHGSQSAATSAFTRDAAGLAGQGYYPVAQSWAPGAWGCGAFILALLLCLVLVGFLVFIYMLVVKPAGTLTVTYEYRATDGPSLAISGELASGRGRTRGLTDVYPRPDLGAPSVRALVAGTIVDPLETRGVFTRISAGNVEGWVRTDAIELGQFTAPAPADKTCPRCAESVKAAAQVCRFCGHEFEQTSTS